MSRKQAEKAAIEHLKTLKKDPETEQLVEFFMYFPTEWDAYVVKSCLMNLQFSTSVHYSEASENWLCLAQKEIKPTTDRIRGLSNFFEQVAAGNNGNYDGWGTAVEVEDSQNEN